MDAINSITREKIKAYLEIFINHLVASYKDRKFSDFTDPKEYLSRDSIQGRLKPFHASIIPQELLKISEFERGFSTVLGTTFEECACLIARDHHLNAQRGYSLAGNISTAAISQIEREVAIFEHAAKNKQAKPSLDSMISNVLGAQQQDDLVSRTSRVDLFVLTQNGTEYYFEMKSPVPNKGQCIELTQRILRINLMRQKARSEVKGYFAMAYNPFGPSRADYKWSFAKDYFPFDDALLIGQEFWSFIGGDTTYEELLSIYQEVGREKAKYMIDTLAFGF